MDITAYPSGPFEPYFCPLCGEKTTDDIKTTSVKIRGTRPVEVMEEYYVLDKKNQVNKVNIIEGDFAPKDSEDL